MNLWKPQCLEAAHMPNPKPWDLLYEALGAKETASRQDPEDFKFGVVW